MRWLHDVLNNQMVLGMVMGALIRILQGGDSIAGLSPFRFIGHGGRRIAFFLLLGTSHEKSDHGTSERCVSCVGSAFMLQFEKVTEPKTVNLGRLSYRSWLCISGRIEPPVPYMEMVAALLPFDQIANITIMTP